MKSCTSIALVAVLAIVSLPTSAASIAERLAREQADSFTRVAPIKIAEGITVTHAVAEGPQITLQYRLESELSKSEVQDLKNSFVQSACSVKIERAHMSHGLTRKYLLNFQNGEQLTFKVTPADCNLKRNEHVQFTPSDVQSIVTQAKSLLPIKFSEELSFVGARAEGMKYHQVLQLNDSDKLDAVKLENLRRQGCANLSALVMISGGIVLVMNMVNTNHKPIGRVVLTSKTCPAS